MLRSSDDTTPRWWHRPALVRVVPAVVVLVLGLVQLLRRLPLWYDEAYTRLAAGVPPATLLRGVWHRTGVVDYLMDVPPSFNAPYYMVMHLWCAVAGTSEFALRLPSVLAAAAAAGVLAELVRRQAGSLAGLLCGLLCATGPLYVDQAIQARSYGLAVLALSLCALWLLDWLAAPRRGTLVRLGAAAAAAGLMHWFSLPVLAGFALTAVLLRRRSGLPAALTLVVAGVPAATLVGWSLAGGAVGAPSPPVVGLRLPWDAVRDWSQGYPVLSVALVGLALAGLWRGPRRTVVACWFFVPMVLITGLELVRPTYFARYLLFTLLALVIAAAFGVAALRPVWLRATVAAALVTLSLAGTLRHAHDTAREPSPAAVRLLATDQQTGQPIVPADGRTSLDLETYLKLAPRLADDLVLPPVLFTNQTSSDVVWLVRVVLKTNSLPIVPAEQRLIDAGWTQQTATTLTGSNTDLRVEKWIR